MTEPHANFSEDVATELAHLRASVDAIDEQLMALLRDRFQETYKIGVLKRSHSMPPADLQRESKQLERLEVLARKYELNPHLVRTLFVIVTCEVKRKHQKI